MISATMLEPKNSYIEVRLKGGLGNQLFQYAAARGLAYHTKAEHIVLNLSYLRYLPQRFKKVTIRHYELDPLVRNWGVSVTKESLSRTFINHFSKGKKPQVTRYYEYHPGYEDRFWSNEVPVRLEGYFHSEEYFKPVASALREEITHGLLKISAGIPIAPRVRDSNSLGVHVRRGDYLKNSLYASLSKNYYHATIEVALAETLADSVFLFSDDPGWLRENGFAKYGEIVNSINQRGLEEFAVLTQCNHFVIANSSFSWWAAWLGMNSSKRVYAPASWFAGADITPDSYFPQDWVRMPLL